MDNKVGVTVRTRDILRLERIPRYAIALLGLVLNALVGLADYYAGHEVVLSSLYVLPVALVTWYAGPALGVPTAVISAGLLAASDIAAGMSHSHPLVVVWNGLISLLLFLIVTYLLVALRRSMRKLEESTSVDSLTGAASPAFFYDSLDKELNRAGRYGHPFTLAYMDLDGFKSVNDKFGHPKGDEVLRLVAHSAKMRLRKTDVVARLGGDEFAFLCPETDEEAARAAISEVVDRLADEMRAGGWPVTFSVGVVTCHSALKKGEELVSMADDLMYAVKSTTKNDARYASVGRGRKGYSKAPSTSKASVGT